MNHKCIFPIFFLSLILLFVSCSKDEGYGGKATIRGIVKERVYDKQFTVLLNEYALTDEDVYIEFGDDNTIGDDTKTSAKGTFEFNNLLPGKYRIYVYSEDSVTHNTNKIPVIKEITISKDDRDIDLGTFITYNTVDYDEGLASLTGTVKERIYDREFAVFQGEYALTDEDVFIESIDKFSFSDDVKTSANGAFRFYNLIPGKYRIYIYSEDSINKITNKIPIIKEITITKEDTVINLGLLTCFRTIDYDDGSAIVKGSVYAYYWSDGYKFLYNSGPAKDHEVYLIYNNRSYTETRIRTAYDGTFAFPNLIIGKYKIYSYSENNDGIATEVTKDFEITKENQVIKLDSMEVNIETNYKI